MGFKFFIDFDGKLANNSNTIAAAFFIDEKSDKIGLM